MPATVVNSAVNKPEEKGSGLGNPPPGMDPIRSTQALLAISLLEGATKAADKLLNSNLLGPAENALWDGMKAAERELRGEGLAGEGPDKEEGVA